MEGSAGGELGDRALEGDLQTCLASAGPGTGWLLDLGLGFAGQMAEGLGEILQEILPFGCVCAGIGHREAAVSSTKCIHTTRPRGCARGGPRCLLVVPEAPPCAQHPWWGGSRYSLSRQGSQTVWLTPQGCTTPSPRLQALQHSPLVVYILVKHLSLEPQAGPWGRKQSWEVTLGTGIPPARVGRETRGIQAGLCHGPCQPPRGFWRAGVPAPRHALAEHHDWKSAPTMEMKTLKGAQRASAA